MTHDERYEKIRMMIDEQMATTRAISLEASKPIAVQLLKNVLILIGVMAVLGGLAKGLNALIGLIP